jgi:hypothetical protein
LRQARAVFTGAAHAAAGASACLVALNPVGHLEKQVPRGTFGLIAEVLVEDPSLLRWPRVIVTQAAARHCPPCVLTQIA